MRLCMHSRNSVCSREHTCHGLNNDSREHTCQGLNNGTMSASCPPRACWWEVLDNLHKRMHCKALRWQVRSHQ